MKNYFLISEFAKLRGININSLRYYEKMGILKPAYVDKNNGYRYYSLEQVPVLNNIILCIQLGIPLRELKELFGEDGSLLSQKLLELGRETAQRRIEDMQNNLKYIDFSLNAIEENKNFEGEKGIYKRKYKERKIMVSDYLKELPDAKNMIAEVAKIYKLAQENNYYPILPAGHIIELDDERNVRYRCFLEIVNYGKYHPSVITIPENTYECVQVTFHPETDLMRIIEEFWGTNEKQTIIVNNMMSEKYSFHSQLNELQKL